MVAQGAVNGKSLRIWAGLFRQRPGTRASHNSQRQDQSRDSLVHTFHPLNVFVPKPAWPRPATPHAVNTRISIAKPAQGSNAQSLPGAHFIGICALHGVTYFAARLKSCVSPGRCAGIEQITIEYIAHIFDHRRGRACANHATCVHFTGCSYRSSPR